MIPVYTVLTRRNAKAICRINLVLEGVRQTGKSQVVNTGVNFTSKCFISQFLLVY